MFQPFFSFIILMFWRIKIRGSIECPRTCHSTFLAHSDLPVPRNEKFSFHQVFVQASSSPGIPSPFSLTWAITIPPSLRTFPRLGWQPLLWAPAAPKAYPPEHLPICTVSFVWWRITDHYSGLFHLPASGSPNSIAVKSLHISPQPPHFLYAQSPCLTPG